jgi:heme A synthase
VTGTVAALADTLFHATSLGQGFQLDFSASANPLLRLRIIHPLIAVAAGGYLLFLGVRALGSPISPSARRLAHWLVALVTVQFLLGALNLVLLAPLGLQLAHLLTADLVWITLVLLSAKVLTSQRPVMPVEKPGLWTPEPQFQSQPEHTAVRSTMRPTKQA